MNNRKVIEKVLKKSTTSGIIPTANGIFKNSIVSEDKVKVNASGTIEMGTTQVTAGGGPPAVEGSLESVIRPSSKEEKFQSAIFKLVGNPYIKHKNEVRVNLVSRDTGGGKILSKEAKQLTESKIEVSENGVGKLFLTNHNIGNHVLFYDIILVNADKLIIEPSYGQQLNENKTIVICSGDIEVQLGILAASISNSTFFW